MPMSFNLWVGRRVGSLVYYFSGKRARITYANLKAAFGKEKTPAEIRKIARGVYRTAGETFAELMSFTKVDKAYVDKYIRVENFDRVVESSKNPSGMIFASAHFGDWELATVTSVIKGIPLHLIARDQKMKRLNELLNMLRELKGNQVVRKGMDIKNVFRLLRSGKSIGILGDQNAGMSGILVDFFGRPASTAQGPYRFAQATGATVLPAFIHRVKGPYQHLVIEEPMTIKKDEDVTPYVAKYSQLLEKHIRNYPEQWFWMHKKWKVTPLRKVLVLDDGKKGHLKQSLAIVKEMEKFRLAEGFAPEYMEVEVVKIRYKSKLAKFLLNAAGPFVKPVFNMHLGCLKMALDEESYTSAVRRYADIIVSSGSSLYTVNAILKMENNCRNAAVMDPGVLMRGRFNLIVLPAHDARAGLVKRDNVVVTDLAPNLIDSEGLEGLKLAYGEKPAAGSKINLGFLIGGDNDDFSFSEPLGRLLVRSVEALCKDTGAKIFVTTSRRTPGAFENIVSSGLSSASFTGKFISGKTDKDEKTVEKILAVSDALIVSGDSISMVSEAVSSTRPVVVFMPDKKTKRFTKHERFLEGLREKGMITIAGADELAKAVASVMKEKNNKADIGDKQKIKAKLHKLF